MGSRRHADHLDDPQQRDHPKPSNLAFPTFEQPVVPPHPESPAFRSRLVHVPDQHRSDGPTIRIF